MIEADILKYWYDMEFFSPTNPSTNKDTKYLRKQNEKVKWVESEEYVLSYDVYVGKARVDDLINEMVQKTGITAEDKIEKDGSTCCLCGFKVDDNKEVIPGSFSISPFMYAMANIIKSKSIDVDLKEQDISKINGKINSLFIPGMKITEQEIFNTYINALKCIDLSIDLVEFYCIINCKKVRKRNAKKEDDKQDDKTDILESFYAKDIKWVLENAKATDSIYDYVGALNKKIDGKVEIDLDVENLKEVLNPNNYPMGKWPSIYKPSLMQQVAINLSINRQRKQFSVNGPPGTGKTTLLKEIIASYIVDRAEKMSHYKNPDDAFEKKNLKVPFSFYSFYYELDPKISDYGILVASNNNKAVENITIELPKLKDMRNTMTNLFNLQAGEELYFTNIANNLSESDDGCWGLISARLGNKSNINKFKQALWYNDNSLRDTKEKIDWNEARQNFKLAYDKVLKYRKYITKAISDIQEYELIESYNDKLQKNVGCQTELKNNIYKLNERINYIKEDINLQDQLVRDVKCKMSLVEKIINLIKTNKEIVKYLDKKIELRNEIQACAHSIFENQKELNSLKTEEEKLNEEIAKCKLLEEKITKYRAEFDENYAGKIFWEGLRENPSLQKVCPWTTKEYDKLREELFYSSLILQKAFVLNSVAVRHNLGLFVNSAGVRNRG